MNGARITLLHTAQILYPFWGGGRSAKHIGNEFFVIGIPVSALLEVEQNISSKMYYFVYNKVAEKIRKYGKRIKLYLLKMC